MFLPISFPAVLLSLLRELKNLTAVFPLSEKPEARADFTPDTSKVNTDFISLPKVEKPLKIWEITKFAVDSIALKTNLTVVHMFLNTKIIPSTPILNAVELLYKSMK
ncbi:hypothetical protein D3C84_543060 [compost metagenome]